MPLKTNSYINFIPVFLISLLAAACAEGPSKRATEDENMISVRARNHLATENPAGLVRVGEGFEKSGNYQSALNLYGQAMAADPSLLEAQIAYARVLGALGAFDKAVFMLSQILEEMPDSREARRTLIHVYCAAGEFKAATLFAVPLKEHPNITAGDLSLLGRLEYTQGQSEEGIMSLQKAIETSSPSASSLKYLAYGFALNGNYETAVALLQKIIDMPGYALDGQESLAKVYALSGQTGAALQLMRTAKGADNIQNIRTLFQLLPSFSATAQAQALMFEYVDPAYLASFLKTR